VLSVSSCEEHSLDMGHETVMCGQCIAFETASGIPRPLTLTYNFIFIFISYTVLVETYDKWERRAPLCPEHVQDFLRRHPDSQVLVQPSFHRIFSNQAYQEAGATIQEDLSDADVILGVKRPESMKYEHKLFAFFSHVIKGQPENMGLLQETLDKKNALMDYECIVDDGMQTTESCQERKQKRTVAFGKYAGMAGMIDTFSILGRRLLLNSYSTQFLNCPPAIFHSTLEDAKRSVRTLGEKVAADGLPSTLEPLVFAVTAPGGNVHQGVQEILTLLPHERVEVADLPELFSSNSSNAEYKVYCVAPTMQDIYQHSNDGQGFDRDDFQVNPHLYSCTFADSVARYSHVLMNCVYWDHRFPRLLTKEDMLRLYDSGNERYEETPMMRIHCIKPVTAQFFKTYSLTYFPVVIRFEIKLNVDCWSCRTFRVM
jgi:alpha-aminoadipic semialdehyde synthase